jgi:hypothetical protein
MPVMNRQTFSAAVAGGSLVPGDLDRRQGRPSGVGERPSTPRSARKLAAPLQLIVAFDAQVSTLWIFRQILVDGVSSQGRAQLGELCLVDNVNALALHGGLAGHRGLNEMDVRVGQAE